MPARRVGLFRAAIAMLAGIGVVASALSTSAATETTATETAPRTTAIAWADCVYGLETVPTPPLAAYLFTPDGLVMRSFDNGRVESAVIGPKRYRAIADGIDHSTLFDPPPPAPSPHPGTTDLYHVGPTDTRRTRFAVRRDGEWDDWSVYRDYTEPEWAAVGAAYAAAYDKKLKWRPAAPRANAFAVCDWGAPREAMVIPASPTTSKWGVAEILVVDCRRGTAGAAASPVYAYRLMRSGNVARTTVDSDTRVARRTENADIGSKTMADFGARLERSGFFQNKDMSGAVASDTGGQRLSALRDDVRTTWSSERSPLRANYSEIMSAILAKVSDPGLKWAAGQRDDNVFSMCTQ
ncbi:MAG TPA: hypothetical protein VGC72_18280 [Candidatus Elarobacter sp.]